jgi:colanic acid/amylovoran biosynthesis protein
MPDEKHRVLCVGNGSSLNRGCEGITRGTIEIIRRALGPTDIILVDHGNTPDLPPVDPDVIQHSISVSRWSRAWFVQHILRVLGIKKTWFPVLGKYIDDVDAVLALGGDNYSMDYGSLRVHLAHIDYALTRGKPFVIWGGSVGPFDKRGPEYENYVAEKLKDVTAILAREDATVEYLAQLGVRDNVRRVADPAFVMDPVRPPGDVIPFPIPADAIGFNFSALMARYMTEGDIPACIQKVTEIVCAVVDTFGRPVLLVPHSQKPPSDDYLFLNQVRQAFVDEEPPVYLLPRSLNAPEIKWAIGNLACFAGARMHSTVAALSSAVPTLSFSYSIKSVGLNRDMFDHEAYVLSPEEITPESVVKKLDILLRDEEAICHHLESRLPAVREQAFKAGDYLKNILQHKALG